MPPPRETRGADGGNDTGRAAARRARIADVLLRAMVLAGSVYWLLCLGVTIYERQLTFQIAPNPVTPEASGLEGVRAGTLRTADGETLVTWRAPPKAGQPTILYFHGNGDTLAYRARRVAAYQAAGYGVFMMAYRGYSGSTGAPSEAAIVTDALLAYDTLRREGVTPENIVLYGESLGSNVATQVAVSRPAAGLVLEAPFTSMVDAWRQFVPFLPVGMLLEDRFDTMRIIADLRMPLLVIHGVRDRMVGIALGRRVFAAAPEPKRLVAYPESGHTTLYANGAMTAVRTFIADVRAGRLKRP